MDSYRRFQESGLYYLQSRYYDPNTGRFINADALVTTGQGLLGNNMFAYCGNSPIARIDSTGYKYLINEADLVAIGGGIYTGLSLFEFFDALSSNSQQRSSKKKPKNLPSWSKLSISLDHIVSGHMPGGGRNPDDKKTVFYGVTVSQMLKIIQEAYNNSSRVATVGDRILLQGFSYMYGKAIEIWLNVAEMNIETAYPLD